jgi:hypothetical protein
VKDDKTSMMVWVFSSRVDPKAVAIYSVRHV